MKQILLFFIGCAFFASCTKSSGGNNVSPKTNTLSLTGNFKLYKTVDTDYNPDGKTIGTILYSDIHGDTAYNAPGTKFANVQPSPNKNYNGNYAMADTLIFPNATAGIESDQGNRFPFTYSLQSHDFVDDPTAASQGFSSIIIQLDANNIEIIAKQKPNNILIEAAGFYYKKF